MKLKKRDGKDNTTDDAGQYFQVNFSMKKNFPDKRPKITLWLEKRFFEYDHDNLWTIVDWPKSLNSKVERGQKVISTVNNTIYGV